MKIVEKKLKSGSSHLLQFVHSISIRTVIFNNTLYFCPNRQVGLSMRWFFYVCLHSTFYIQALLLYNVFLRLRKTVLKENQNRRSILALKQKNGTFLLPKSSFCAKCSIKKVTNSSNQITFKPKKMHFQKVINILQ